MASNVRPSASATSEANWSGAATAARVWDDLSPDQQFRALELLAELSAAIRTREVLAIGAEQDVPVKAG